MTSTPVTGESSRTAGIANKNTYKGRQGEKENFNNILGNVAASANYKPPIQQNKPSESANKTKVDHVSQKDTVTKENSTNDKNIAINDPKVTDKNTAINDPQQDSVKDTTANDVGKTDVSSATKDITVEETAIADEMQTLLGQIQQEIADQLGISLEELASIMQSMGMGITDLLNQSDLSKLVVQVMGEGDMLSLATNEELYGRLTDIMKEVQALVDGFQQEFSISDEDLAQLLKDAELASEKLPAEANKEEAVSDSNNPTISNGMGTDQIEEEPMIQVKVSDTLSSKDVTQTEDTQAEETITTTDNEEALEGVTKQQQDGAAGEKDKSTGKDSESNQTFANQMQSQNAQGGINVLDEIVKQSGLSKEAADTGEVIKQILDYMKIHINKDATEMEMQLHPASLGSIHLQVALRAGAITAQFSAQNEAVKTALESQIVQLKENLEAQGLKIEAVEVTIASHEFERNLEQDNKGEQSKESKAKSRKQIKLDENFDYEGSGLEEEQLMEVDMMARNGNTVDFSV